VRSGELVGDAELANVGELEKVDDMLDVLMAVGELIKVGERGWIVDDAV